MQVARHYDVVQYTLYILPKPYPGSENILHIFVNPCAFNCCWLVLHSSSSKSEEDEVEKQKQGEIKNKIKVDIFIRQLSHKSNKQLGKSWGLKGINKLSLCRKKPQYWAVAAEIKSPKSRATNSKGNTNPDNILMSTER